MIWGQAGSYSRQPLLRWRRCQKISSSNAEGEGWVSSVFSPSLMCLFPREGIYVGSETQMVVSLSQVSGGTGQGGWCGAGIQSLCPFSAGNPFATESRGWWLQPRPTWKTSLASPFPQSGLRVSLRVISTILQHAELIPAPGPWPLLCLCQECSSPTSSQGCFFFLFLFFSSLFRISVYMLPL